MRLSTATRHLSAPGRLGADSVSGNWRGVSKTQHLVWQRMHQISEGYLWSSSDGTTSVREAQLRPDCVRQMSDVVMGEQRANAGQQAAQGTQRARAQPWAGVGWGGPGGRKSLDYVLFLRKGVA